MADLFETGGGSEIKGGAESKPLPTWEDRPGDIEMYGHLNIAPLPPIVVATIAAVMLCALAALVLGAAHLSFRALKCVICCDSTQSHSHGDNWIHVEFDWCVRSFSFRDPLRWRSEGRLPVVYSGV